MQKTAPNHAPPAYGSCPTDEELAAYIDGNLDEAERARITEHLGSCEDCYSLYAETAHFLVESSPASPEDAAFDEKVVPFPSHRKGVIAQWGAIAALLLVGVGAGTYFQLLQSPPALVTGDVTASIPNRPEAQKLWFGPRLRGESKDEEEIRLDDASFRLGVQLVNLQTSLRAKNLDNAEDSIAFILGLLKSGYLTEDLQHDYIAMKAGLVEGKAPAQLLPEASRLAQEAREPYDPTALDLGQFVEAGRLASLARDPSFFQQSEARGFLRRLIWRDRVGIGETRLDPPTRESLREVLRVLGKGDLQAPDYAELSRQFEKILEVHYPEA